MLRATGFIIALFIINTELYASSIRTQTLGQIGTNVGSFVYEDDRNVFYNPAYLQSVLKNMIHFQLNEGGYFRKSNKKTSYSLYYGRKDELFTEILGSLTNFTAIVDDDDNRPIELFFARKSGSFNWGVSVLHVGARGKSQTIPRKESIRVSKMTLGVNFKGIDFFTHAYLQHEGRDGSTTIQERYSGHHAYGLGLKTHFWRGHQYITFKSRKYSKGIPAPHSLPLGTTGLQRDFRSQQSTAGISSHLQSRKKKIKFYYGLGIDWQRSREAERYSLGTGTKIDSLIFPLNLAFEMGLFSWLKLRAGAVYDIYTVTATRTATTSTVDEGSQMNGPEVGGTVSYKHIDLDFKYNTGFDRSNNGVNNIGEISLAYIW